MLCEVKETWKTESGLPWFEDSPLLYYGFYKDFVAKDNFFYADFLMLVKVEAKHISFFQMKMVEISKKLLFTPLMVGIATPDLKFNDILLAQVINHQIHPLTVTGFRFDIAVPHAVDNRL